MAERAISQKKAQNQFLNTFAPVTVTLDELVRDKLKTGQFLSTKTGWIKAMAIIVSSAALALFFAQTWDVCVDKPEWYTIILPACIGSNIVVQLFFYLIFSCGCTVRTPGKWVTADIVLNLIFAIVEIIGSVMCTASKIKCSENSNMHGIPAPVGIAGGMLTIVGCGAIFLLYRYVEEDEEEPQTPQAPLERNIDLRKSMHA